ncbi:MAG: hypothetical protein ACR2L2_09250 [Acidobacteriota bacterium]
MNYYNYFTEVEEHFLRRRDKNVLVSPLDWSLIDTWKTSGIPLAVVLRGIDRSFDENRGRSRPRRITSLFYCHPAVARAFEEYLEAQVGRADQAQPANADATLRPEQLVTHLSGASERLRQARGRFEAQGQGGSVEAIDRALARLGELTAEVQGGRPDLEALDQSLVAIEELLAGAIAAEEPAERRAAREMEIRQDLKVHKKKLAPEMFERLQSSLRRRRIVQQYQLPSLSLFSL